MPGESQGTPPPNGGGQGSGAPGAPPAGGAFSFQSEDEFNERMNRGITGRLRDFEKKIENRFGELQTGLGGRFDEIGKALEGLKPAPAADPAATKGKAEPAPFKLEDSPEWKAHQTEIAGLKKLAADTARERDAERAKTRTSSLRSTLADALTAAGVPADRHRHAIGHLVAAEHLVDYADEGKGDAVVWRGTEGEEPLPTALKAWLKTSDGKLYLPPVNPGGSGGGPGRPAPIDSKDPRAALRAATRDLLNGNADG